MRVLSVILLAALFLASCADKEPEETARMTQALTPVADAWQPPTLSAVRPLGAGLALTEPVFAPGSGRLLATGPRFEGLFEVTLADETVKTVAEGPVGYGARYAGEAVVSLGRDERERVYRGVVAKSLQKERGCTLPTADGARYCQAEDRIWRVVDEGNRTAVSPPEHRAFGPRLAPGGKHLLYQGLTSGLHLLDLTTGTNLDLGRGSQPRWTPDGEAILFVRTTDDGLRLTASEIYHYHLASGTVTQLTDTLKRHEQHPTLAPDGRTFAFDANFQLYVAEMR